MPGCRVRWCFVITLASALVQLQGCVFRPQQPRDVAAPTEAASPATAPAASAATSQAAPVATDAATQPVQTPPAAGSPVSAKSIAYARELGGVSQKGRTLYFVIGDSLDSEAEAQRALTKATPSFGDMQAYFIVQKSDNFEGMRPGYWVVIEAYENPPADENLQFGRRGFPDAYVKKATVLTDDPIPVYEQLVAQ